MRCSVSLCSIFIIILGLFAEESLGIQARCAPIRLLNGKVRPRARGKMLRFRCNEGFTIVGPKYSNCINGKWDTRTPVCVSPNCPMLAKPENGIVVPKYNGGILTYFCDPGYKLIGSSEMFCNGKQWSSIAPTCRDSTAEAPRSCDFEKPDLCWWEQDPKHDFDWRRQNFDTPSWHIGTGPTHDHTLGQGEDGYYMYIEASGPLENETARMMSPLYNASLTKAGCFSFWYHMYGRDIGALRVYFRAETDQQQRLMFTMEGNQGNEWMHGIFDLPKIDSNFQIIVEGVRGRTYVSDIAIDDVAILQGNECYINSTTIPTISYGDVTDQLEIFNAMQSCKGRCTDSPSNETIRSLLAPSAAVCLCSIDCAESSSCCPDYAEFCILEYPFLDTTEFPSTILPTTLPTSTKSPLTTTNNTIRPLVPLTPEFAITTHRDSIQTTPKHEIERNSSTSARKIITTVKPTTITTKTPVTTTKSPTKPNTLPSKPSTVPSKQPSVSNRNITIPVEVTTKKNSKQQSADDPQIASIENFQQMPRGSTEVTPQSIIGIVVGTLTVVVIAAVLVIVVMKRRRNYKRGAGSSGLSDDSDVRFLTSVEVLDFNLAKPSEAEYF